MTKPICIVQGPFATRSGYGDMCRDIIQHIIDLDYYDLKLISTPWGATPMNALDVTNPRDHRIINRIVHPPINVTRQPELFIHVTIPQEFMPVAKYNIGITAGIETNLISKAWIDGCNKMNAVFGISRHAVEVIKGTRVTMKDPNGNVVKEEYVTVPLEVLHNCVYTDIFKKISSKDIPESVQDEFAKIKEKFCFLFVGHWLRGNMREDRKNVGLLVHLFCETFKNISQADRPALILKTSGANFSILDREEILDKINIIRSQSGPNAPNVYLLHGELSLEEMNGLYNHPKVKVHVSFTKGEGFGRPLLEASMSEKPIIASGWSGQLDFLDPENAILLPGQLKQVEGGSVWENIIIPESSWFNVDENFAKEALMYAFKNQEKLTFKAKLLAEKNRREFNYDAIKQRTKELLDQYVPKFELPQEIALNLPTLKKIV